MAKHRPECFFILARGFSPTTLKWSPLSLRNMCISYIRTLVYVAFPSCLRLENKSVVFSSISSSSRGARGHAVVMVNDPQFSDLPFFWQWRIHMIFYHKSVFGFSKKYEAGLNWLRLPMLMNSIRGEYVSLMNNHRMRTLVLGNVYFKQTRNARTAASRLLRERSDTAVP